MSTKTASRATLVRDPRPFRSQLRTALVRPWATFVIGAIAALVAVDAYVLLRR